MSRSTTLLFAHGGGFCKDTWEPIIRRLRDSSLLQTVSTRFVSFDFKYHGSNRDESVAPQINLEDPRGPRVHHPATDLTAWTSADVLQQARALKNESVDTSLIGIAHSMGASAMWNTEVQHPGTFDGLVLFEPNSPRPSRAAAEKYLRKLKNFAAWDRESLDAYMKGGLVEDAATGTTVLACSPGIEAALYSHTWLDLTDQQLAQPQCKICFHYGTRTKMFLPSSFKELTKLDIQDLEPWINQHSSIIMGGDFNCVLRPSRDRTRSTYIEIWTRMRR
ncbi:hypothetical protein PF001_g22731 [Phytophthora fragariae]|uniref:AB hydrolase-1 domain-containing protein n=1 Tax=Phytophthora fragariae TaxID=53985 RepID=A0A6A4C3B8_9STRA|nr:hypothetical protein PF001_g22731 [Phytophthora fragariae]